MKRVACVVVLHDGAVLGVSRKDAPGDYVLPGGEHNEALGEDLAETAARELKKKTGLTADPRTFVQLLRGVEPGGETQITTFLARSYQGTMGSTELCMVCWVGWPALLRGAFGQYSARVRAALVDIDPDSWVDHYGSGSLRRAREEGMRWREMYLAERTALEFGYGFQPVPSSRVAFGDALACGDDPGTTETCWWARALRFRAERSGQVWGVDVVHVRISDGDGGASAGIGIRITLPAHPPWLPSDRKIVALTVGKDGRTVNPC